jgi:hypothetical protein
MKDVLDPNAWEGDSEQLIGHEDELADSAELCEQTFASKQEAFTAGLYLGGREADQ